MTEQSQERVTVTLSLSPEIAARLKVDADPERAVIGWQQPKPTGG